MTGGNGDWHKRLFAAIDRTKQDRSLGLRSDRRISLTAGVGENYVNQLRRASAKKISKTEIEPVLKVIGAINASRVYIFTGVEMSVEAEEMLARYSLLTEEQRKSILDFLRSL